MKVDGSCHCGRVTYRAEIDPEKVGMCNCTDCQKLSGTAFQTLALVPEEKLEFTGEQPKTYKKTGDSGNVRVQGFCGHCGSPIYATSADDSPKVYALRLGSMNQRQSLQPKFQLWHRSAFPWVAQVSEIPAKDQQ